MQDMLFEETGLEPLEGRAEAEGLEHTGKEEELPEEAQLGDSGPDIRSGNEPSVGFFGRQGNLMGGIQPAIAGKHLGQAGFDVGIIGISSHRRASEADDREQARDIL